MPGGRRMKILEPWGRQKLSFLLEKAASREEEVWRVYVPKKPFSQVRTLLIRCKMLPSFDRKTREELQPRTLVVFLHALTL